ncbi:hypothetical protein SLEP1_g19412 [Rubroshorea leprosula]|nr:hypothetical protein SLEP1_g19412 [Rubroshorea leprosula]
MLSHLNNVVRHPSYPAPSILRRPLYTLLSSAEQDYFQLVSVVLIRF